MTRVIYTRTHAQTPLLGPLQIEVILKRTIGPKPSRLVWCVRDGGRHYELQAMHR